MDDKNLKIVMMNNHHQEEYIAKGIPEKIIEELSTLSEKIIISSSNKNNYKSFAAEFRTSPATKVWERIVNNGLAEYNDEKDIHTYTR